MVDGGESAVWSSHFAAGVSEALEGLLSGGQYLSHGCGYPIFLLATSLRAPSACLHIVRESTIELDHEKNHTNVEQNCAIVLLVDDVVLKNLVVQGPGGFHCRRHVVSGWSCGTITVNAREKGNKKRKSGKTGQSQGRNQVYLKLRSCGTQIPSGLLQSNRKADADIRSAHHGRPG